MNDTPEPHDPHRQHEQAGRRAARLHGPAGGDAVRLQLQPAGDDAGPESRAGGAAARRTCSRSCSSRSSPTRRAIADVVLPATTFLENYDIAKGYGPISLQLVRPGDRARRRSAAEPGRLLRPRPAARHRRGARRRPRRSCRIAAGCRQTSASELLERGAATPPFGGRPIQFVDVFPLTPDRKIDLFPEALEARGAGRPLRLPARPGHRAVPAGADFSGEREDGLVDARRAARAARHAADAPVGRRGARTRAPTIPVRVFNDLGEVHCPVALTPDVRPGTVSLSKGLWRKSTYNGSTSNALVARHADRSRRRRVLQRRPGAGGAARAALSRRLRLRPGSRLEELQARLASYVLRRLCLSREPS